MKERGCSGEDEIDEAKARNGRICAWCGRVLLDGRLDKATHVLCVRCRTRLLDPEAPADSTPGLPRAARKPDSSK